MRGKRQSPLNERTPDGCDDDCDDDDPDTTSDEERANRDEWLSRRYIPNGGIRYQKSVDCTYGYVPASTGSPGTKVPRSFAIGNQPRLVAADRGNSRFTRESFNLFVNY